MAVGIVIEALRQCNPYADEMIALGERMAEHSRRNAADKSLQEAVSDLFGISERQPPPGAGGMVS